MKNLFLTVLASCLFFSALAQERETPYQEGELLIQFLPRADIEAFENDYTFLELRAKKLLSRRMNIWLFEYNPARATGEEAVAAVYQHRDVLLAQLNHFVTLRGESSDAKTTPPAIEQTFPNDPQFPNQWALNNTGQTGGTPDADIDAPEAWDIATGGVTKLGDEIIVAVIDGGGELTHSDLSFWKNIHEIPNNGIDDDNNGYVDDYNGWNAYSSTGNVPSSSHGTHVSGIAAAKGNNALGVSGVNWNAKVMPIAGSSGTESIVVEAYGYALEQRARYNETNGTFGAFVVVTNSSFGVDFGDPANFPIWCAMYDSMGAQGILSCGATANLNINIDIEGDIPTACPSDYLLSVTNTTSNDLKNSGAAYGLTTIDLGAPGTSILNTDVGNSYSSKTGTSMASPTVAGAVALLYAAASPGLIQIYKDNPAETALLFKQWIMDGTDPIPSLQGITVTGGRLNVYNSAVLVQSFADSLDPNPPANITAYSDYTTPASMQLAWDDPTHYAGGDPLLPGEFTIEIQRDSVPVASIPGGAEQYTDMGLNDGQLYTYRLYAKVIATDSTSEALEVSWHAGGSPVPAAPANLACAATATSAILTWEDPTAQEDGTPLDDLDHINIYRNGSLAGSAPPGAQTYTDNPPPGFTYTYTVRAVDDETPPNLSAPGNAVECFVGSTPNFLVWVGPDATGASAASGDSIFDALVANGKSSFLTNDLFEFGADLSIYDAIFVVLGIFPNNHEIVSGDPEGQALQSYLQNGGSIYLEGGDCFNYDPETGGYNIRPWFGLNDGPDGSADMSGVTGLNDLSGFNFAYNGENNWMDELQPSGSTSIWKNSANNDLSGVFYAGFGSGKSIGVVPSFGGLVDNPEPVNPERGTLENYVRQYPAQPELLKARPERGERRPFAKKAAYPEQSQVRNREIPLYRVTPSGVEILANTKEDLMAAYLDLLIDATCTTGLLGDVTGDDAVNSTDGLIMLSYDAAL
ncbi:MAG: S8 family serine peptidase, partial [Calditrichia bacterium]|nr:S8 family serine peptidase [Calditrichia bacterium]